MQYKSMKESRTTTEVTMSSRFRSCPSKRFDSFQRQNQGWMDHWGFNHDDDLLPANFMIQGQEFGS